mmetsp:Transcript_6367/g.25493  ORF Transcript_6367/g.25493 Transcript_6367/m.25493 type:complete len:255 (+) Transcript_6367:215-979(+)
MHVGPSVLGARGAATAVSANERGEIRLVRRRPNVDGIRVAPRRRARFGVFCFHLIIFFIDWETKRAPALRSFARPTRVEHVDASVDVVHDVFHRRRPRQIARFLARDVLQRRLYARSSRTDVFTGEEPAQRVPHDVIIPFRHSTRTLLAHLCVFAPRQRPKQRQPQCFRLFRARIQPRTRTYRRCLTLLRALPPSVFIRQRNRRVRRARPPNPRVLARVQTPLPIRRLARQRVRTRAILRIHTKVHRIPVVSER